MIVEEHSWLFEEIIEKLSGEIVVLRSCGRELRKPCDKFGNENVPRKKSLKKTKDNRKMRKYESRTKAKRMGDCWKQKKRDQMNRRLRSE